MLKKNLSFVVLLSVIGFFSGCSIIETTYDFYHHGTESIKTNSNFKYVNHNVTGKARTTYYPQKRLKFGRKKVNEPVQDGLMTEAKRNLHQNYPLADNQAFANLSIDVLETRKAKPAGKGVEIQTIVIEVVVSADIIEYY